MERHVFRFKSVWILLAGLLVLSGCASSIMTKTDMMGQPDPNHAVVTFLRPTIVGCEYQFGIWDGENFVGELSASSYIQHLCEPGEHIFLGRCNNWSYVKADLQGGKNYYIIANFAFGVRVYFDPITKNDEARARIDKWMTGLKPTTIIPEKRDAYVNPRLDHIQRAVKAYRAGNVRYEVLEAHDYH